MLLRIPVGWAKFPFTHRREYTGLAGLVGRAVLRRVGRGHLALRVLALEQAAHEVHREQMRVDEHDDAVLVQRFERLGRQFAQLVFVNHAETAIDEGLIGHVGAGDRDFAVHQNVELLELFEELAGALARFFEFAAEFEETLRRLCLAVNPHKFDFCPMTTGRIMQCSEQT